MSNPKLDLVAQAEYLTQVLTRLSGIRKDAANNAKWYGTEQSVVDYNRICDLYEDVLIKQRSLIGDIETVIDEATPVESEIDDPYDMNHTRGVY